jgi:hypothetical protein
MRPDLYGHELQGDHKNDLQERPSCALAWAAARRSAKTRSTASGNNHGNSDKNRQVRES